MDLQSLIFIFLVKFEKRIPDLLNASAISGILLFFYFLTDSLSSNSNFCFVSLINILIKPLLFFLSPIPRWHLHNICYDPPIRKQPFYHLLLRSKFPRDPFRFLHHSIFIHIIPVSLGLFSADHQQYSANAHPSHPDAGSTCQPGIFHGWHSSPP